MFYHAGHLTRVQSGHKSKNANNMLGLDQLTSSSETLSLIFGMFDALATSIVALCLVRLTVLTQLMTR